MRPPGYEPGELPTAPLRDNCTAKVIKSWETQGMRQTFFSLMHNFTLFMHTKELFLAHDNGKWDLRFRK